MTWVHKWVDGASRWMLREEVFGPETFLAICTFWAAHTLLTPPSNFAAHHLDYELLANIMKDEERWGLLAACGALAHVLGLGFLTLNMAPTAGIYCRCMGLVISGFFWSVIGWSFILGNPDSITAVPMILIGLMAIWTLLRFPFVPPNHLK